MGEKVRGKCYAYALSSAENIKSYISNPNIFFLHYSFDREAKTLSTELRKPKLGANSQATNIPKCEKKSNNDNRILAEQLWSANSVSKMGELENYLTLVKSVGILARCSDPMTVAKKSSVNTICNDSLRDTAIQMALNKLHASKYKFWIAIQFWVNENSPVMVTDQCEMWTSHELKLFEESLETTGKNFGRIYRNILKWKTVYNIVDFYYLYKTTGRYVEAKLRKIYSPECAKAREIKICKVRKSSDKNPMRYDDPENQSDQIMCESCQRKKNPGLFYYLGASVQGQTNPTVCEDCWIAWKKLGFLLGPNKV